MIFSCFKLFNILKFDFFIFSMPGSNNFKIFLFFINIKTSDACFPLISLKNSLAFLSLESDDVKLTDFKQANIDSL